MSIIHLPTRFDKRILFIAVRAYIDTVEVFFPPHLRADQLRTLEHYSRPEPCRGKMGKLWGWRLIMNQPRKRRLLRLDPIAREYRGVLSRFDVAIDGRPSPPWTAAMVKRRIVQTAILKWRKKGQMRDEENGVFWVDYEGGRKPTRNLGVYADKVDRFTGEPNCVHLELRFLRAETIRRQGIRRIKDLIGLDPNQLFQKHVNWAENGDVYVNKVKRKAVKEDQQRYRGKQTTDFTDRHRSLIPLRVEGLMERRQYDRSQVIRDRYPHRRLKLISPPFAIPSELTWKDETEAFIEDKGEFRKSAGR